METGEGASAICGAICGAIKGQYHAALSQLAAAIRECPDGLWTDPQFRFPFWHVAYHALFYTHLYSSPDEKSFKAWSKHRKDYQFQESTPWPPHTLPGPRTPYTREELLAYVEELGPGLDRSVDAADLEAPSGFFWLKLSKLELHLYNLRHLEHHTGQLVDRLRNAAGVAVDWVAKGNR